MTFRSEVRLVIEVPKIGGPWLIKPGGEPYVRFPGAGWAALIDEIRDVWFRLRDEHNIKEEE